MNQRLLRRNLWANGYRPVAIKTGLKHPTDAAWTETARRSPPACIQYEWTGFHDAKGVWQLPGEHLNTGIQTDEQRPIDIDFEDDRGLLIAEFCFDHFGVPPIRFRDNSPRLLLLYGAAAGSPPKAQISDGKPKAERCAVEVLGHGNQFLAFGHHPSGAELKWQDDLSPLTVKRSDLPVITENQVVELLRFSALILGVEYKPVKATQAVADREKSEFTNDGDVPLAVLERALAVIPPTGDREVWRNFGFACYEANPMDGIIAWTAWSRMGANFNPTDQMRTWNAIKARKNGITRGSIFGAAKDRDSNWWRDEGEVQEWWTTRSAAFNEEETVTPLERLRAKLKWRYSK